MFIERLKEKYGETKSEVVRSILAVVIAGLFLFALVNGISSIGFSDEVENNRVLVLLCSVALALLIGLGYEIWVLTSRLRKQSSTLEMLRAEKDKLQAALQEAEEGEESLLRLMENYKGDAYDQILTELRLLLRALDRREEWNGHGARVERVRVEADEQLPQNMPILLKTQSLSEVIINIGREHGVLKGMQFEVVDPSLMEPYGTIIATRVAEEGTVCSLAEGYDSAFWARVESCVEDGGGSVLEVTANVIRPVIPQELQDIEPEAVVKLTETIENIPEV